MNRYKNSKTRAAEALHLPSVPVRSRLDGEVDPLRDGDDVDVVRPDVEEARRAKGDDRGPDVGVGDHLYTEHIGDGPSESSGFAMQGAGENGLLEVGPEQAGDEDFAFLVEDEECLEFQRGPCWRGPESESTD